MGVKQLWNLLGPVGRPVLLETMEGKVVAIDSSIWIYQFQATMRDKDGRALVNAHLVGFLRRICKLLFYGMKPVFVFDGGAPALKKSTLTERRKKKSGAAASHAKVAERILAAQMRREAINLVAKRETRNDPRLPPDGSIDENAVFLEDLEPNNAPRTPSKKPKSNVTDGQGSGGPSSTSAKKSAKARQWQDHDPYSLPDIDLEQVVAKAMSSALPDPRLATEEELRSFIEDMRPEDFDLNSEAFRELPTEVQYEIIGDLRLKSRQTSHKRLQTMLKSSNTPLDFSKAQIKNLQQRNTLTQQLLVTTDMVGKAHLTIPTRIASERNREYMLIKNEGAEGGWVLSIRDDGTKAKPIDVDAKNEDSDSDEPKEIVASASTVPNVKMDTDLRKYQQTMALSAIARRYSPKKLVPLTTKPQKGKKAKPLFIPDELAHHAGSPDDSILADEVLDPELSIALQESLNQEEDDNIRVAMEASLKETQEENNLFGNVAGSSKQATQTIISLTGPSDLDPDPEIPVSEAQPRANSSGSSAADAPAPLSRMAAASMLFGLPTALLEVDDMDQVTQEESDGPLTSDALNTEGSDGDDEFEQVAVAQVGGQFTMGDGHNEMSDDDMEEVVVISPLVQNVRIQDRRLSPSLTYHPQELASESLGNTEPRMLEDIEMGEEPVPSHNTQQVSPSLVPEDLVRAPSHLMVKEAPTYSSVMIPTPKIQTGQAPASAFSSRGPSPKSESPLRRQSDFVPTSTSTDLGETSTNLPPTPELSDEEAMTDWSRSPSPELQLLGNEDNAPELPKRDKGKAKAVDQDFDAANEIDPQAEEGDFATFMSQIQGRDLAAIRNEIDEEIMALNKEKKAAMRDSEDVTQAMIGQIKLMLRLFGIPYLSAPLEAEAQCAALVELGLVDKS